MPNRTQVVIEHREISSESVQRVTVEHITASRGISSEKLSRRLRDDLDVIVMKALREEPERRYTSAEAFLEDIRRHLEGLPVAARRDSFRYRIHKFFRRHRVGVSAVAGFILLIIGFLVIHTTRVTQERNLALTERDIANTERDKANEIAFFLEELLSGGDPAYGTTRSDTLRLQDFVQLSVDKVRNEFDLQPAVKAQILNTLGKVHGKVGMHDQGKSLFMEALELRTDIYGENHPAVGIVSGNLALKIRLHGDPAEAERIYHN